MEVTKVTRQEFESFIHRNLKRESRKNSLSSEEWKLLKQEILFGLFWKYTDNLINKGAHRRAQVN